MTGSVAEWSKALVLGTSLSRRGFESLRCQNNFGLPLSNFVRSPVEVANVLFKRRLLYLLAGEGRL